MLYSHVGTGHGVNVHFMTETVAPARLYASQAHAQNGWGVPSGRWDGATQNEERRNLGSHWSVNSYPIARCTRLKLSQQYPRSHVTAAHTGGPVGPNTPMYPGNIRDEVESHASKSGAEESPQIQN